MISAGSPVLDALLGGYQPGLTLIYGPSAAGKTTLVKLAAIQQCREGKKVLYLDTEGGFSVERFIQLAKGEDLLPSLLLLRLRDFQEQTKRILKLDLFAEKVSLIIVDTIGMHYRVEVRNDPKEANRWLDKQLKTLSAIAQTKNLPVLLTNQVYTNPETGAYQVVGGNMLLNWSKSVIELQKEPRCLRLRKPGEGSWGFEIVEEGLRELRK